MFVNTLKRSFLSKGTVFLLKPQLLLWFCTNSNGHLCKQACTCLLLCSARFRTLCFISLCLCLLLPWERSFLSKGTVFLLKPQLLLWFCTNSNGHPCKQACRCLFLFVQKSSVFVFYGNIGTCCKPSFSGNPNIMFMFWTA